MSNEQSDEMKMSNEIFLEKKISRRLQITMKLTH